MLETMEIKNGIVNVYDEDGFITIDMGLKDVKNIMDFFNSYILNEESVDGEFIIENEYPLDLSLRFDNEGEFSIEGRLWDLDTGNSSYFHYFNIENASVEDWEEIYNFINNNY